MAKPKRAALAFIDDARRYADRVITGAIKASHHAVLACERFDRDYAAAVRGDGPWEFRADLATRAMLFAAQMSNIKGPDAGKPLLLMDWQKFVFANIFGFVKRGTTTRRFRQAGVFVPKGYGKTTILISRAACAHGPSVHGELLSVCFCSTLQIRQCKRSTSATITVFARILPGSSVDRLFATCFACCSRMAM